MVFIECVNNSAYECMVEMIRQLRKTISLQTTNVLRTLLLEVEYRETKDLQREHVNTWKIYGCSLIAYEQPIKRKKSHHLKEGDFNSLLHILTKITNFGGN